MLRIIGKTDIGKVRENNQDDFAYGLLPDGAAWAVVCDGMGGASGGSVASSIAVHAISEGIESQYTGQSDEKSIQELLLGVLKQANEQVYKKSRDDISLHGMGTTVVACLAKNDTAFIGHAGDSRAYLIKSESLEQLTVDHSVVQEMVDKGQITQEEAQNHPNKNLITRALGVESTLKIDFGAYHFPEGTGVLLCSDGLSNLVDREAIVKAFGDHFDQAAEDLIGLANENGGTDNITAVIVVNANGQE